MSRTRIKWMPLSVVVDELFDFRGRTPKKLGLDWGGTIPALSALNVQDGRITIRGANLGSDALYARWMTRGDCRQGDVLFTTEAPLGNVAQIPDNERYILSQRVILLRAQAEVCSNDYLAQVLRSPVFAEILRRHATGSTAQGIKVSTFTKLRLPILDQEVQPFVCGLLTASDRRITVTRHLIQARRKLKRGLLQQLLTGERRFPEFQDQPWVERKLGDVVSRITRTNTGGSQHALTISGRGGFIDQKKYFSKIIAGESIGDSYLIHRGEFAYNRSLMKGYPYGATKRLDEFNEGVVSKLYIVFAIKREDELDSDFLLHLFESGSLNHQLCRITNLGARAHGLLNIVTDDFFGVTLRIPPMPEQRRIATALNTINREIQLLTDLHEALKEQKKGLMQQLLTGKVRVPASMVKETADA